MFKRLTILLTILYLPLVFAATPISVCTDTNFWYPFTFVKDKKAAGLHIDIIHQALINLGYEPNYKPLPWEQCLSETKAGHFDAIATVSYHPDRDYILYPPQAASDKTSPLRVTQVEYLVITPAENEKGNKNTYSFDGDLKTIPNPVRVPAGYSIIENLEREGLKVEENPSSLDNFKKLAREKTGSVIDLADMTKYLGTRPEFSQKWVVSSQPIFSKSYYLGFSKKGKIKEEEANKIWQEIAKIRDNPTLMEKFLKKY